MTQNKLEFKGISVFIYIPIHITTKLTSWKYVHTMRDRDGGDSFNRNTHNHIV